MALSIPQEENIQSETTDTLGGHVFNNKEN